MLVPMPIVDDLVVDMSSPQLISGENLKLMYNIFMFTSKKFILVHV